MTEIIFGVDPSSVKLAVVVGDGTGSPELHTQKLPSGAANRPAACAAAYDFGRSLIDRYPGVTRVGIEAPVKARGGLNGMLPQVYVSGAFQAALGRCAATVELITVPVWKKNIVGYGDASKDEIGEFVRINYPKVFAQCVTPADTMDQDLLDAYCLYLHTCGLNVIRKKMTIIKEKRRAAARKKKAAARTGKR